MSAESEPFDPAQSPLAWFADLVWAVAYGDFKRAANCQNQLERLGWIVTKKPAKKTDRDRNS